MEVPAFDELTSVAGGRVIDDFCFAPIELVMFDWSKADWLTHWLILLLY